MLNSRMSRASRGMTVAALAMVAAACSESTATNVLADKTPPTVTLTRGGSTPDTVIAFQVEVRDNLGIKNVKVDVSGGVSMSFDTTFTSPNTDATIPFTISVPRSIPVGTPVVVTAKATDGALNSSPVTTLGLTVGNLPPAEVNVISPVSGTIAVLGKSIIVVIKARSAIKVRSAGFRTSGGFALADSILYSSPLPDSASVIDTVAIPTNARTAHYRSGDNSERPAAGGYQLDAGGDIQPYAAHRGQRHVARRGQRSDWYHHARIRGAPVDRRGDRRKGFRRLQRQHHLAAPHVHAEPAVLAVPDDRVYPGVREEFQRHARLRQAGRWYGPDRYSHRRRWVNS